MRIAEIYEKPYELSLQHDSTMSETERKKLRKSWMRDNIRPKIVLLAAQARHEDL